ncbi:hypothetical protein H6F67_12225 [Microcoleus sp. FACHB-1515]|uniref:hypothetical protein n=1 Tax=Cyanophyceae TaxID=3028117 RepID=UPI00168566BB|nr:hypothetical protein [Microcoleus sp. FACHB-1515]MBD2090621.1 hypothetical protein [Microcoleus sp. FACHB-1515]
MTSTILAELAAGGAIALLSEKPCPCDRVSQSDACQNLEVDRKLDTHLFWQGAIDPNKPLTASNYSDDCGDRDMTPNSPQDSQDPIATPPDANANTAPIREPLKLFRDEARWCEALRIEEEYGGDIGVGRDWGTQFGRSCKTQ